MTSRIQPCSSCDIAKAWGDELSRYYWNHWGTFTFAFPTGRERAERTFIDFATRLEGLSRNTVTYFASFERTHSTHYHIHALLGGTFSLRLGDIERSWFYGHSDALKYEVGGGAPWYVAKWLHADSDNYILSRRYPMRVACPPAVGSGEVIHAV